VNENDIIVNERSLILMPLWIRDPYLEIIANEKSLFVNEESFFGYQHVRDVVICEYGILIRE